MLSESVAIVLLVLSCLVGAVWCTRHALISIERKRGFLLTHGYPGPPHDPPRITVLVAAKDEEENIETCIRTMLDQDYPDFELVVCNDRSEDDTSAIVERIARDDPRVRLINIEQLPDGWCGKNNAMQTGIDSTESEWICMIDADCRQTSPRTLSCAMQYALDTRADMLSVLPNLEMRGFWENVIQPVCGGVMMIWFNPEKVNNPDRPHAYANGAFILMKRSTYKAIGEHRAVRDEVNEDMHMAARAKQSGLRLRVVRNYGLYKVRMYTSLKEIVRGWGRIFFGTFGTPKRLGVSLIVLVIMGLVPYAAAIFGFLADAGNPGNWALASGVVGSVVIVIQLSVIYRFYGLVGARKELAWTYVLGCIMAMLSLLISISKLRKGAMVTWRGTTYNSGISSGDN